MTEPLKIDGEGLTLEQVEEVARGGRRAVLEETAAQRVEASRCQVEELLAEGRVVYGVTTGIGKFCDQVISPDSATRLQRNIIRSHAAGVGEPLREDQVRAAMLPRANSLARGLFRDSAPDPGDPVGDAQSRYPSRDPCQRLPGGQRRSGPFGPYASGSHGGRGSHLSNKGLYTVLNMAFSE